jgi:hypothetical protein
MCARVLPKGFIPAISKILHTLALTSCLLSFTYTRSSEAESKGSPFENGPKTIASRERVSVLIDREIANGKSTILLKISVPTDSTINAFLLPDPARLVVDFEGASVKKSENFTAPENGVIKQIRLGSHPGKLRVVVDLVSSTPPEYEWKAGKRQAIISFVEGSAAAPEPAPQAAQTAPTLPPAEPTLAPAQPTATTIPPTLQPTSAPTTAPTTAPTVAPTFTSAPPANTPLTEAAKLSGESVAASGQAAQLPLAEDELEDAEDLADLEQRSAGPSPTKVPTAFSIKGYKFEYMPDKTPVLKILLNKPRAQAQISKVDSETYKIDIKDCGVENEDLELPQFPPHDFVGFVMVVAETVGKNVEVSISVEEDIVLGTTVQENEIWVKKP